MKNLNKSFLPIVIFLITIALNSEAQDSPIWTRDINALPDTNSVRPVRTLHDSNNNIFVLSSYSDNINTKNKIYLKKYSETGVLDWTLIYDNNGKNNVLANDMAMDGQGNSYIVGGFIDSTSYRPLLIKVSSNGNILWLRDSTLAFNNGFFYKIIIKNNRIHLKGNGVVVFDLNGNEKWSKDMIAFSFAVDNMGQMIVSGLDTMNNTVFRLDSLGSINFADSSIYYAQQIAIDTENSFYLLTGSSQYELVKYDSAGIFQWSKNAFPPTPAFGDISIELLIDYNNDVVAIGLADSMYKFSDSGALIWEKSMNGLDNYIVSAHITFNNIIAIAGTLYQGTEYSLGVATFNLNGDQNWSGEYNANIGKQEFVEDMSIDNSGIYIIENDEGNTKLVKFNPPYLNQVDYSLICVDSVWYNQQDPNSICIRVFNGNIGSLNYPSVQIVSPTNDTIGNPKNTVDLFAHLGNTYQTYCDTITITNISSFNNYTFLLNEGFGDTTHTINKCFISTGIDDNYGESVEEIKIYPNPIREEFTIYSENKSDKMLFNLYDISGRQLMEKYVVSGQKISRGNLSKGFYIYSIYRKNQIIQTGKLVVD